MEWRCRARGLPYGDQALFLGRDIYEQVGGFADIPVMEDYDMVRRLGRLGRVAISPASVKTSDRRWRRCGIWRTTLVNQLSIAAYRLGVSPQRLARWRGAYWDRCPSDTAETAANDSNAVESPS